jgi:hypothetical protein
MVDSQFVLNALILNGDLEKVGHAGCARASPFVTMSRFDRSSLTHFTIHEEREKPTAIAAPFRRRPCVGAC